MHSSKNYLRLVVIAGHNAAGPVSRCPYPPAAAPQAAVQQQFAAIGNSSVLASAMSSGGKGAARRVGDETGGKRLLVGEVRLDRHIPGWAYKISLNEERLPPKNDPKWTVRLEVPVGDCITLEASSILLLHCCSTTVYYVFCSCFLVSALGASSEADNRYSSQYVVLGRLFMRGGRPINIL